MSALVDAAAPAPEPVRTTDSAALALDYADRLIMGAVRDLHLSVASRLLPASRLVGGSLPERVHSMSSNALYAGLSTTIRGSANGLRALARRGVGTPLEASLAGRQLLSTINALVGAELAEAGDPGGIRMALRVGAGDVPVDPAALEAAYPQASGKIVLFLHGLGENDESWQPRQPWQNDAGYATRVARETDWTPLVVRYNTGMRVSDNGAELAALIGRLATCWPVPITSIAFVGHSMGGLLARSATVHALAGQRDWVRRVTHVVCLGTPHLGAQGEKAAHLGARALALVPSSAARASARTVPLRHAYVSRDDWAGHDVTAPWGEDRIAVAPLSDAAYHFVAAGRPRPQQLAGRGDHVRSSGTGSRDSGEPSSPVEDALDAGDHVALLSHPQVADGLVTWLQGSPDAAGGRTDQDEPPGIARPGRHRAAG